MLAALKVSHEQVKDVQLAIGFLIIEVFCVVMSDIKGI